MSAIVLGNSNSCTQNIRILVFGSIGLNDKPLVRILIKLKGTFARNIVFFLNRPMFLIF